LASEATADSRVRPRLGQPISATTIGLCGKHLLQALELRQRVVDGGIHRHTFPVRPQCTPMKSTCCSSSGCSSHVCQGLGGADRLLDAGAGAIQISLELLDRQVAAEDHLRCR